MKKVAIIGTVGVPASYGGYETLVENLVVNQKDRDLIYYIYCSSKVYTDRPKEYCGAKLIYLPFNANGWQAVIYDTISMIHSFFYADVILSLGTVGCFVLPIFKLFSRKKVIVNLDGLDNKREKWNIFSKIIIGGARWFAAKFADVIISDNEGIKNYVKEIYKKDSILIEYGGDNATKIKDDNLLMSLYGLTPRSYSFKVARIEPENNIEIILKAYSLMPNTILVIVGNWAKNDFGKLMKSQYSSYKNIHILDAEYDSSKLNLLRSNCSIYIHGHSAGGTNPSLVEAMNLELPIIAFDVVYNRHTTENKALYFIDTDQLCDIVTNIDNSIDIAKEMKEIASRRYTWSTISEKYEKLLRN